MGWAGFVATGYLAVTTKLETSYLYPVCITDKPVRISGRLIRDEGKTMRLDATIRDGDGKLCTTDSGTYHKISRERYGSRVRR